MKSALLFSFLVALISITTLASVNAQNSTNTTMSNSTMNTTMGNSTMMENTTMMANTTMGNTTMMMNTTMGNSTMMENTTMMMNSTMAPNTTMMMNSTTMMPGNTTAAMMMNTTSNMTASPMPENTTTTTMNGTAAPTTTVTEAPTMPPPMPCSTLMYHDTCYKNNSCMEFNASCAPRCGGASAANCDMWPHCQLAADSTTCIPKCSMLMVQDACIGSEFCAWYNGKCDTFCPWHKNEATCVADPKCSYDSTAMTCHARCDLATDASLCNYFIQSPRITPECTWDGMTKMCKPSCMAHKTSAACAAQAGCAFFPSTGYCYQACDTLMDQKMCENSLICSWFNGTCSTRCIGRLNEADCLMNAACSWSPTSNTCSATKCNMIMNKDGCMKETYSCQWDASSNMCKLPCTWASAYGNVTRDCLPAPYCNLTASDTCQTLGCAYHDTEPLCTSVNQKCVFVESMCKPSCATLRNEADCTAASSYCNWRGDTCHVKCDLLMSKSACVTADAATSTDCAWSDSTNKCYLKCSENNRWPNACAASSSCVARSSVFAQVCTPLCSLATSEMDCKSPFFQDLTACFWDKDAGACKTTCEYATISAEDCAAPCMHNSNFSICALTPPPTTTTMMPSTTGADMNTTAMAGGSTTAAAGNETMMMNSTTAAGTGAAGSTTTAAGTDTSSNSTDAAGSTTTTTMAAGTTTIMAATTAAPPVGIPRVQFTVPSTANATGNVTVEAFTNKLASLLGVSSNSLSVTIPSSGVVNVEFIDSANANTEYTAAQNLNPTELSSLGAASVSTLTPATTTAAPEDDEDKMPLIIGAAVGGFVLLVIILVVVKKSTSGGSGAQYLEDDKPGHGDAPMLQVPQQQGQRHNML